MASCDLQPKQGQWLSCLQQNKHTGFTNLASERNLIKEWHPVKNGALNPRDIKPGYNRKVWWICENGHEWQATINRRLRDGGCPSCIEISYEVDRQLFGMTDYNSNTGHINDIDSKENYEKIGIKSCDPNVQPCYGCAR